MKPVSRLVPSAVALTAVVLIAALNSQFAMAEDLPGNFVVHERPRPVAPISFEDTKGTSTHTGDFKGKVVVLNLWATWCIPCRREMPALDRMQTALDGPDFAVVPLSIDHGGLDKVTKFYSETGLRSLPVYVDVTGEAIRKLAAVGLPTTLILDRDGNEVTRIIGPAEWDAPEVLAFLKSVIAKESKRVERTDQGDNSAPTGPARSPRPPAHDAL